MPKQTYNGQVSRVPVDSFNDPFDVICGFQETHWYTQSRQAHHVPCTYTLRSIEQKTTQLLANVLFTEKQPLIQITRIISVGKIPT